MNYKGYRATVQYDADDNLFVGRVQGINDIICFHGSSVDELSVSFHSCVDNYLDMCAASGKLPEKEYKGSFNVRISPELHRKAAFAAEQNNESLNQFVANAISTAIAI